MRALSAHPSRQPLITTLLLCHFSALIRPYAVAAGACCAGADAWRAHKIRAGRLRCVLLCSHGPADAQCAASLRSQRGRIKWGAARVRPGCMTFHYLTITWQDRARQGRAGAADARPAAAGPALGAGQQLYDRHRVAAGGRAGAAAGRPARGHCARRPARREVLPHTHCAAEVLSAHSCTCCRGPATACTALCTQHPELCAMLAHCSPSMPLRNSYNVFLRTSTTPAVPLQGPSCCLWQEFLQAWHQLHAISGELLDASGLRDPVGEARVPAARFLCACAAPPGSKRSRPLLRRRGLPRSRESMRLAALDRNWVVHAPQMPPYGTHHTKARPCLYPTLPYTLS